MPSLLRRLHKIKEQYTILPRNLIFINLLSQTNKFDIIYKIILHKKYQYTPKLRIESLFSIHSVEGFMISDTMYYSESAHIKISCHDKT